jgi:hypothetical protein
VQFQAAFGPLAGYVTRGMLAITDGQLQSMMTHEVRAIVECKGLRGVPLPSLKTRSLACGRQHYSLVLCVDQRIPTLYGTFLPTDQTASRKLTFSSRVFVCPRINAALYYFYQNTTELAEAPSDSDGRDGTGIPSSPSKYHPLHPSFPAPIPIALPPGLVESVLTSRP